MTVLSHQAYTKLLEVPFVQHYRQQQVLANLCLEEISFTIFPSEKIGIEYKKEKKVINNKPIKKKTRVNSI
jgi:hypothetical protein